MDKKTDAPNESGRNAKKPGAPPSRHAFVDETDEMHQKALAEIKARGEDPKQILSAMASMKAKLRDQYQRPEPDFASEEPTVMPDFNDDPAEWDIGDMIFFEESVAAGIPTPGSDSAGRPAEMSDLMKGFNPTGKLLFKIACFPPASSYLEHGDKVLVDPDAKLRDGHFVLADLAGHGQVVLRVRTCEAGESVYESDNPDMEPIKDAGASDLRVHGKIIWRWHPIR